MPEQATEKYIPADLPVSDHSDNPRIRAKHLFYCGHRLVDIAEMLGVKFAQVKYWKSADHWESFAGYERVISALDARLCLLIIKDPKSAHDFKEIDNLSRQLERFEKLRLGIKKPKNPDERRGGLNSSHNYLSPENIEKIKAAFHDNLFKYQDTWWEVRRMRNRLILKSRQIGATYYFAREALVDALDRLHPKIFLSASKAQAWQFRAYIVDLVYEACGVELRGDPLTIRTDDGDVTFRFLGTNSKTAQSYHGDIFIDEIFWIARFEELKKVASGMASHKQWSRTYISTPSAVTHEAYPFWTGEQFNDGRPKAEHVEIDVSENNLKTGKLCDDGIWRHFVTVEEAQRQGCDLFDIEQLKREYSPDEYAQLFMCEFVDDSEAVFKFSDLQRCLVDSWEVWGDFRPFAKRPLGNDAVAIGIDPAKSRDGCAVIVIALPRVAGGKFRIVERLLLQGSSAEQATQIKPLFEKYEVEYAEIDESGLGIALAERVAKIYPGLRRVSYDLGVKNNLIAKALEIIDAGRLEIDAGARDWMAAFLAIKKVLTDSGRQMTYKSERREGIGHADMAWATMHALACERLGETSGNSGRMTVKTY
ncbi:MAG: hypothetical protein CR975_02025 [Gammaproteobacteria bacterium]|nr:MAG: hypothetical protein CR975_02025 [Gammaproteobacteria bacterium]